MVRFYSELDTTTIAQPRSYHSNSLQSYPRLRTGSFFISVMCVPFAPGRSKHIHQALSLVWTLLHRTIHCSVEVDFTLSGNLRNPGTYVPLQAA